MKNKLPLSQIIATQLQLILIILSFSNLAKAQNLGNTTSENPDSVSQQLFEPTWTSLKNYEVADWFRDAKFGIFIHWGVYSVPAFGNEWYPRYMYLKDSPAFKHHIETYGDHTNFGYKDFIPMFKAEKFDADKWAVLFKKSGARYVVPVAEHHDGFAMYNTALSEWNAVKMGPKRDIIDELSKSVKKQGLIFGLSSHRIEHWWFMNGGRKFNSDVNDSRFSGLYGPAREEEETMSPEFMIDWLMRTMELVEQYQPQLIWFDWWIQQPALEPYRKSFASYYYNKAIQWGKQVVINYKLDAYPEDAAVFDIERGSSRNTKKYPWQTDTSIGKRSWAYIDGEENKTSNELIDILIDIVSKNGNLLLNIGPKADGTITFEQESVLLEMGKWLEINGEGIYDSRPWKISGEGPTKNPGEEVRFGEKSSKEYIWEDIRFTQKGEHLYVFLLDIPKDKIKIQSLSKKANNGVIANIELLGSDEAVVWKEKTDFLEIQPSEIYPSKSAVTYKVTFGNH